MNFKPVTVRGKNQTAYETDTGFLCVLMPNKMGCSISLENEQWPSIDALFEVADKLLHSESFIVVLEAEFKQVTIIKK